MSAVLLTSLGMMALVTNLALVTIIIVNQDLRRYSKINLERASLKEAIFSPIISF